MFPIYLIKIRVNLLLLIFFQSCLRIIPFATVIFDKKSGKKLNCGRLSENGDVTLPVSVSFKEAEFEKTLSINVGVLKVLVCKSIRGYKKLETKSIIKIIYCI